MRYIVILSMLIFISSLSVNAQTNSTRSNSFEEYRKRQQEAFDSYVKALNERWNNFKLQNARELYSQPKIENPPILKPDPDTPVEIQPSPRPSPPIQPISPPKSTIVTNKEYKTIHYMGNDISINYPADTTKLQRQTRLNDDYFAQSYSQLNKLQWQDTLEQIQSTSLINDYAILHLVDLFSSSIFTDKVRANLLTWFLMNKLGYKIRLAYIDRTSQVILLYSANTDIFDTKYISIKGTRFYLYDFSDSANNIKTYSPDFDKAKRELDFSFNKPLALKNKSTKIKNIKFNYQYKSYTIPFTINQEEIDFLNSMPPMSLEWYKSQNYSSSYYAFVKTIKPLVSSLSDGQRAEFLLSLVQSLPYQTDQEQFGYENYLFPSESIAYIAADCEDRSILYSALISDLTNLRTLLIKYPGHVAVALEDNNSIFDGDSFSHENKRFIFADPTYIGAPVGLAMPNMGANNIERLIAIYLEDLLYAKWA